ncbi:MAG: putative O-glycosylation ligase, exosortase A system-associated, partial [Acetobacteraceae bacterium]
LFVYVSFLAIGLCAPFVLTLGYVWVDTFRPQEVAYVLLNQFSVSAVMGAAAIISYVVMDRRAPPPPLMTQLLTAAMAAWITTTLLWAVAPEAAWIKWDWAFKTVAFAAFMPLVIRSRIQIEAVVQVYLLALAANFVTFGAKTLISGGGYGTNLGLQGGNSGLAEGGLLSTACLMAVPLALYLAKHNLLAPKWKIVSLGYLGLAALAVITAIGTYQRSALIGLVVLGVTTFMKSRHKLMLGAAGVVVALVLGYLMSERWTERVSTITEYNEESSALGRILVWQWTLEFAAANPLGGGFNSFIINHITYPGGTMQFGKAFHSIYFEMLGEHGWPGLIMFLTIVASTMLSLRRLKKRIKGHPDALWCSELANALQVSIFVFMSAGAFVGIAFQPMFWHMIALSVSLRAYVIRIEQQQTSRAIPWRRPDAAGTAASTLPRPGADEGWRGRASRASAGARRT